VALHVKVVIGNDGAPRAQLFGDDLASPAQTYLLLWPSGYRVVSSPDGSGVADPAGAIVVEDGDTFDNVGICTEGEGRMYFSFLLDSK
jgi:hypothetical protein